MIRLVLLVLLIWLGVSGCARENAARPAPDQPTFADRTTATAFHLDLPPFAFRADPANAELAARPLFIAPADLTRLYLRTEQLATGGRDDARLALEASLQTISPASLHRQPPELIKQTALATLRPRLGPADLPARYNAASASLTAVQQSGSWQCNTGTSLFFLSALRLPANEFRGQHFVFIHERGHVLPGYLRRRDGAWHLFGVEMTVLGAGQKRYGAVTRLAEAGFALRIVQAPEALMVRVVGPYVSNGAELARHVLQRTAERYGIPLADLERNIQAFTASTPASVDGGASAPALGSPWSFGIAEVPPGDRPMMRRDQLDPRNNRLSFSEVLALLPADATSDDPTAVGGSLPPTAGTEEADEGGDGNRRMVYPWEADYPGN